MELKIKRIHEKAIIPKFANPTDAGMDLFSIENLTIEPGERKLVSTGIVIELPAGTEGQIRPRSGLAIKNGITVLNSPGTIDCVPAGTSIETPYGKENVEDIFKSKFRKLVYSFNEENFKVEEDIVSDMWLVENLNLIKIETETSCIEVPEDKEIYTKRGWIKAKNLLIDDEILTFF